GKLRTYAALVQDLSRLTDGLEFCLKLDGTILSMTKTRNEIESNLKSKRQGLELLSKAAMYYQSENAFELLGIEKKIGDLQELLNKANRMEGKLLNLN